MSGCKGSEPVTAKVSPAMRNWLDREAAERGVCRAEFVRLLFDNAVEADSGVQCPHCSGDFRIRV